MLLLELEVSDREESDVLKSLLVAGNKPLLEEVIV